MHAQLRATAEQDIEEAVACYRDEAGLETALDFIDALEAAIADLCDSRLIGTLRFAFELEIGEAPEGPARQVGDGIS